MLLDLVNFWCFAANAAAFEGNLSILVDKIFSPNVPRMSASGAVNLPGLMNFRAFECKIPPEYTLLGIGLYSDLILTA